MNNHLVTSVGTVVAGTAGLILTLFITGNIPHKPTDAELDEVRVVTEWAVNCRRQGDAVMWTALRTSVHCVKEAVPVSTPKGEDR